MSTAIAMQGLYLIDNDDYEPVSDGSRAIQRTWEKERNYLSRSASDWLPTVEAALRGIGDECRNADWDGDGAIPVTDHTIDLAAKIAATLFTLLPKGTPAPDLIPETDGEICISWSVDATRMFSVSVGEHGKINFAGQFGNEGGIHAWQPIHATSRNTLEASLGDVVRYVSRLYAPAAVRRAAG
jgi:hypothetical protein